jgi:hypothetical protein
MDAKLTASLEANKKLQAELKEKTKIIDNLQTCYAGLEVKLNNMEQYNRSWSVRISKVPLTSEEERSPNLMREYREHTAPIFRFLKILTYQQLSVYSKLNFMHSVIYNYCPPSFIDIWKPNNERN